MTGAGTDQRRDSRAEAPTGQRVETSALVSWAAEREPSGALRATGQIDSFTVRTTLPTRPGATPPVVSGLLLLEATLDSAMVRVSTRPPLVNECDRAEASAASLARDILVRVPDGAARGDRWKDSVVTLTCRSGVPIVVHTTVLSTLEEMSDDLLLIRRELTSRYEGKGGSAFRTLEITGTGVGSQRARLQPTRGTLERLEGTLTVTLLATERLPGAPPRIQRVQQEGRLVVERVR